MMTVMTVVSASSFIDNNDIIPSVDMLVNVLMTMPIVVIVVIMVVIVVVSMSATFNNNDSVIIVVSRRSSVQVQETSMDWAITSNPIEVDVDQLIVSLGHFLSL